MPSKRLLMRQARDRARTEVTRLDEERLALKRIAARECGMVLYTQEVEGGGDGACRTPERVHILSLPHEVPWADAPTPEGDADWFRLPEREMRRIRRLETPASDLPPSPLPTGWEGEKKPLTPGPSPAEGRGVSGDRSRAEGNGREQRQERPDALLGVRIRTRSDGRMVVEDL